MRAGCHLLAGRGGRLGRRGSAGGRGGLVGLGRREDARAHVDTRLRHGVDRLHARLGEDLELGRLLLGRHAGQGGPAVLHRVEGGLRLHACRLRELLVLEARLYPRGVVGALGGKVGGGLRGRGVRRLGGRIGGRRGRVRRLDGRIDGLGGVSRLGGLGRLLFLPATEGQRESGDEREGQLLHGRVPPPIP